MPARDRALWALVYFACVLLLLAPAIWNGFALLQYDTGGYLSRWYEGTLEINRSAIYGLLLVIGQWFNFWPVLIAQSALTVWVLALVLRTHALGGRPFLLLNIFLVLTVATTLPWLTGILLADIFAGLAALAFYLIVMRADALKSGERGSLAILIVFATATHSATLAVMSALIASAFLFWLFDRTRIRGESLAHGFFAVAISVLIVFCTNFLVARQFVWTPGGTALSFGRMLESGIVARYLDDHCPDASLKLCAHRTALPRDADDFFWGEGIFDRLGRFEGLNQEMEKISAESLVKYPLLQIKSVAAATSWQVLRVRTGGGVVNWVWNTYDSIKKYTPAATPAMLAARQQRTGISFDAINRLHVPAAWISMALLPLIMLLALRWRGLADIGEMAAAAAIVILANAAVFGIFATPHNRYGTRVVWIALFVVMLALARVWRPAKK